LISVRFTESRSLGELTENEPLLMSALCLQDGRLREACLQGMYYR